SGEDLLRQEFIQQIVLDYLFSESGIFYETLTEQQLIDDSFEYSTTVEDHYNFSLISSNTDNPNTFITTLRQLLESTQTMQIDEDAFVTMRNKRIGRLLREINSLKQIASQFLHYNFSEINY